MSRFARPLDERWQDAFKRLASRIGMLEAKTVVLDSGCYVVPYIATISASYTSGDPTVVMPGGQTIGPLQHLSDYTPHASDVVLVVPAGQTYIVMGTLS